MLNTLDCNLMLYGAHNLMSGRIFLEKPDGERSSYFEIKRMPNARESGSSVINNRVLEKAIILSGMIEINTDTVDGYTLFDELKHYQLAFKEVDRFFRVSRDWQQIIPIGDTTDWTLGDDAVNISEDLSEYQLGGSSIKFDADVSVGGGNKVSLSNSSLPTIDLTEKVGTGNLETWVYLPDNYHITGIMFRLGSDSSNYYESYPISQQYDGTELRYGWNYITIPFEDCAETGTVNNAAIDYYYIEINYTSDGEDVQGFRIDDLIWQNDDQTVNYLCRSEGLKPSDEKFEKNFTKFTATLIAYKGYGQGTNRIRVYQESGITDKERIIVLDFDGSYEPLPRFLISVDTATDIDRLRLTNLANENQIIVTETVASADQLVMDLEAKTITQNGAQIAYDGALPTFLSGRNRVSINFESLSEGYNIEQYEQTTEDVLSAYGSNTRRLAQQFTTNAEVIQLLNSVTILARNTEFVDRCDIRLALHADSSDEPGAIIADLGFISLNEQLTFALKSLAVSQSLVASTKYWLVARKALNNARIPAWGKAGNEYASNLSAVSTDSGSTWTTGVNDMTFAVNIQTGGSIDYDVDISYKKLYL